MATSSIFYNIKINDPKKAEAFVAALEASEKDPWIRTNPGRYKVNTDLGLTKRMQELREKNRGLK